MIKWLTSCLLPRQRETKCRQEKPTGRLRQSEVFLPLFLVFALVSSRIIQIIVVPHTQNIAGGKISGFERKAFTRQNFPDSNVFGFKVPTLESGFKISGDTTKLGCFHFGFVLLCVNGKTNPVLKRSGFITNPEQFPLV